ERAGRHLCDQHADMERGLDEPELGQAEAARQQEHGPDRTAEDDAVEELVEAEDGERSGVHGTSWTRIDETAWAGKAARRRTTPPVWAGSALLVRDDVPQQ